MMHKDLLLGIDVGTTGTNGWPLLTGNILCSIPGPDGPNRTLPGGGTQCAATCRPYFKART